MAWEAIAVLVARAPLDPRCGPHVDRRPCNRLAGVVHDAHVRDLGKGLERDLAEVDHALLLVHARHDGRPARALSAALELQ